MDATAVESHSGGLGKSESYAAGGDRGGKPRQEGNGKILEDFLLTSQVCP